MYFRLSEHFPAFLWPLFEFQPFFWLAMALPGIAALWIGYSRGRRQVAQAGWLILLLLAVWIAMAHVVVTPRERLEDRQNLLVSAAATSNIHNLMPFLAVNVQFGPWNRQEIKTELASRLTAAHITGNFIRSSATQIHGRQAVTRMTVWTQTRDFGPVLSSWRLIWRDGARPQNWRVVGIRLLRLNNHKLPPDSVVPFGR